MTPAESKKKPVAIWIILLVLPFALLTLTAMTQFVAQFAFNSNSDVAYELQDGILEADFPQDSTAERVVNILSVLIGTGSVLMIIVGTPIWVTLLGIAVNHNKRLAGQPPQDPHV